MYTADSIVVTPYLHWESNSAGQQQRLWVIDFVDEVGEELLRHIKELSLRYCIDGVEMLVSLVGIRELEVIVRSVEHPGCAPVMLATRRYVNEICFNIPENKVERINGAGLDRWRFFAGEEYYGDYSIGTG